MKLSRKQKAIMRCLVDGYINPETDKKEWLDMSLLVDAVPYETTKDSMHFSIRHLMRRGLVERGARTKRRGRLVKPLIPTNLAMDIFSPEKNIPVIALEVDGVVETF